MKPILTVVLLAFASMAFAEQELEVTVISADDGKDVATTGIECSSYFTISALALSLDGVTTTHADSVVESARNKMRAGAVKSLNIARAFTLDSQGHTLQGRLTAENDRLIEQLANDPVAFESTMIERSVSCPAFLDSI